MNYNVEDFRRRILGKVGVNPSAGDTVLDVGCGTGADAEFFSERAANVVALDISADPGWLRARKDNLDFLVADGLNLPLADGTFDIVFEKDALHHMERSGHAKALQEMLRVTKVGGKIIVVESNRYEPISFIHMVRMQGHDHFRRGYFRRLICTVSPDGSLVSIQCRVWPVNTGWLLGMIHAVEDMLEKVPLVRSFLNYNIAILQKKAVCGARGPLTCSDH